MRNTLQRNSIALGLSTTSRAGLVYGFMELSLVGAIVSTRHLDQCMTCERSERSENKPDTSV